MFLLFPYPYLQFLLYRLLQKHRKYHGFGWVCGLPFFQHMCGLAPRGARARAPNESVFGGVFGARARARARRATTTNNNSNNSNNNNNNNNNNINININNNNNNNNSNNNNSNSNNNNNNNNQNPPKTSYCHPTRTHTLFPGTAGGCVSSWIGLPTWGWRWNFLPLFKSRWVTRSNRQTSEGHFQLMKWSTQVHPICPTSNSNSTSFSLRQPSWISNTTPDQQRKLRCSMLHQFWCTDVYCPIASAAAKKTPSGPEWKTLLIWLENTHASCWKCVWQK